ncbi:unnamed protein product [Symbiodinium sp. CCMP2456]|nr:unnamed protein product [Symbiodinium sp. CCMP2456]
MELSLQHTFLHVKEKQSKKERTKSLPPPDSSASGNEAKPSNGLHAYVRRLHARVDEDFHEFNPGSGGHPEFCSRPCAYFQSGYCRRLGGCQMCHFYHERVRLDKSLGPNLEGQTRTIVKGTESQGLQKEFLDAFLVQKRAYRRANGGSCVASQIKSRQQKPSQHKTVVRRTFIEVADDDSTEDEFAIIRERSNRRAKTFQSRSGTATDVPAKACLGWWTCSISCCGCWLEQTWNFTIFTALEMSLADAWRAVRQESQDARDAESGSGAELQKLLAEEQRCQEMESACESMSMAAAEAGETASRLYKVEAELSQQCQILTEEKAELLEMIAPRSSEEGFIPEASPDAESLEATEKLRALEQENEALRLKCAQAEEQGRWEEATTRHAEVEEWQTRCYALEADAHKAERLAEELQLKAEELTSSLTDLESTRKGQSMAQELAESLDKSYKELNSEYSKCHAELSEAKQEAERLRQLQPPQPVQHVQHVQPQPTSAPRASLVATAGEPATLGSTVAALRRARASLAGEAIERLPQGAQQAQADPGSPSRDVSAGLKALQRLKAAAAGKAKTEAGAESPQSSSPSGSKAASLIASRSKASSLWLKAAQTTGDAAKE